MNKIIDKVKTFFTGKSKKGQAENELSEADKSLWKNRLKWAEEHHRPYFAAADKIEEEYLSTKDAKYHTETVEGKPVNLVASFVNTILPRIFPHIPWPLVGAEDEGDEITQAAALLEGRERQIFGDPLAYEQLRRCLFDSFFLAGYCLMSWQPNTSKYVRTKPEDDGGKGNNERTPESISMADAAGPTRTATRQDAPRLQHIPRKNIRIDPDAKYYNDKQWISYCSWKRLADLKAADVENDGPYHNTKEVTESSAESDFDYDDEARLRDKADAQVKLWTIYDRGRRPGEIKKIVLAGGNFTEIENRYVQFGTDGFPIKRLEFYDVGRLFPASPEQFWFDLATSFNEFVAEMTEAARAAKNVIVVPNTETRDSLVKAAAGAILVCQDPHMVNSVRIPGATPDTWAAMDKYERLVDKISNLSDQGRGVEGSTGKKTATEILEMSRFAQTSTESMANAVKRWLRTLYRDVGGLLLKHQWQDVTVRTDIRGGERTYGTFSNKAVPTDIKLYSFAVDTRDQERVNPVLHQKRTQETLAILSDPNIHQLLANEGKRLHVGAIIEDHLDAIGMRNIEKYIEDMPDPAELQAEQVARAMVENEQMLETGQVLPVDVQNDDHQVHAQVHQGAIESPAVAEHLAEHYGYLQAGMVQQQAQQAGAGGAMPPMHAGPAKIQQTSNQPAMAGAVAGGAMRQ